MARPISAIRMDKYLHIQGGQHNATTRRTHRRPKLSARSSDSRSNEIAAEVGTALREAHLDFPVFLTVPNSGESLATMACPLDPSDSDWSHASAIVCRIIGQRLGDVRLRGRALHCAVANATMGAADVMADDGERGMTVANC